MRKYLIKDTYDDSYLGLLYVDAACFDIEALVEELHEKDYTYNDIIDEVLEKYEGSTFVPFYDLEQINF